MQTYPEIQKLYRKQGATICFGDEARIHSDTHGRATWAPTGETPVIEAIGARFRINMISAVSAKGSQRFMACTGCMNADRSVEILKRLIDRATSQIFLIHPVNKSKRVKDYETSTGGRLRLFILPPLSPHPNPDEWVWNWLKRHKFGKARLSGPDQVLTLAEHYLRSLQKLPVPICGFFTHHNLAHITEA